MAVWLEDPRESRELPSGPGRKCPCPDSIVGSGFEEKRARLVEDGDRMARVMLGGGAGEEPGG